MTTKTVRLHEAGTLIREEARADGAFKVRVINSGQGSSGFAPVLEGTEDALNSILSAIKAAGYEPGKDVTIALDCASSEFYKDGIYDYSKFEGAKGAKRTADEQVAYLSELVSKYPIDSIEDGMDEGDWDGWKKHYNIVTGKQIGRAHV